jgi:hypothetical protein
LIHELGPGFRRDDGILAKMEKSIVIPAKAGIHELCKELNKKCTSLAKRREHDHARIGGVVPRPPGGLIISASIRKWNQSTLTNECA